MNHSSRLRIAQVVAAGLAIMLVMIFAPRLDAPRIMFGMTFRTKGGGHGLTDLGWLLLIGAPIGAYLTVGFVGRRGNQVGRG